MSVNCTAFYTRVKSVIPLRQWSLCRRALQCIWRCWECWWCILAPVQAFSDCYARSHIPWIHIERGGDHNDKWENNQINSSVSSNLQLSWPMYSPSRPLTLEASRRWGTLADHHPEWLCSGVHCQASESSLVTKRQTCQQQWHKSDISFSSNRVI